MNPGTPRYPVDRYLVERSNNFEMVNIIDDGLWNAEPALRPEDEIILRKLHDMLQSTADDLKLLSGELSKYHEPGVQVKSLPTPLDEDFNEKVHIEEIVNAKFHGYKILDKSQPIPVNAMQKVDTIDGIIKSIATNMQKPKKVISTGVQVSNNTILKKPKINNNLSVTKTRIMQIDENDHINTKSCEKEQDEKRSKPAVAYNELSFKYAEPQTNEYCHKPLQVQNMPSINIRSELKEQKVLQINIEPNISEVCENVASHNNVAVISIQHEPVTVQNKVPINYKQVQFSKLSPVKSIKEPTRKFSKMSSCESSDSSNNMNIINRIHARHNTKHDREVKPLPTKPRHENIKQKKTISSKRESTKHSNLDEWKKKLNSVYGCQTSSRKAKTVKLASKSRKTDTKIVSSTCNHASKNANKLNNAEYIPYSKLTLGGVRVSDIEKELSDIPNRNDIPLSPILDKILSRENSFHTESAQLDNHEESPKILNTSDENLLREVLDIEEKFNKTLSKNENESKIGFEKDQHSNPIDDQDSYVDDFEDDKSNNSARSGEKSLSSDVHSKEGNSRNSSGSDNESIKKGSKEKNVQNKTFTKKFNLSFKNKVDIFEFVHSVDTQETGTQSNSAQKISLKGTQTSPRNDRCNVQPIHNDLWPSIDPKGEVEKLFQLEKDFIKKLIVDEYGDILDQTLNKPSTSKDIETNNEKNVVASQKNTQTSPAHVKSVMTSPTRTKTRTTSPFAMSLTAAQQTSPLVIEELKVDVDDDLGISINLSSPRFSLRLPQTSHEVISNLESRVQSKHNNTNRNNQELRSLRKNAVSSSSSVDGDYSSSDISSLGEVRFKLRKRLQKLKVPSISELSSSTSHSYHSESSDAIIPCRSQGEVSLGQVGRRKPNKHNKSEGEMSLGLC